MTKLTVIVDNKAGQEIKGEWGLSILIEHNDKKILLDAGGSDLFAENLQKLGFDIKDIDYAVLSHAHYDHANGMPRFFEDNKKAKFYLRETTAENCYALDYLIFRRYIGIPKNVIRDYGDRIEFVSGDYKLCDGVYLIPHKSPCLDLIGKKEKMYTKVGGRLRPDNFSHEQSLVIETEKGLVILNSCSHGGAVNIINEIKSTFPDKHIYGLIGGFHLYNKSKKEVEEVAKNISETGIEYICTGHCTMGKAYGIMKEELGDKLEQLQNDSIASLAKLKES